MGMDEELRATVSGSVQGVGFRWTVQAHARRLHLDGTVCNLPDGTVEIHATGERKALENFVVLLQTDSGSAHVYNVRVHYSRPQHAYRDFRIVF